MQLSGFNVVVLKKTGKPIELCFYLDNEDHVELREPNEDLLKSESIQELLNGIKKSFRDPWEEGNDLDAICEWDFDHDYEKFLRQMSKCKIDQISEVIVLTNTEQWGGDRDYSWIRYNLIDKTIKRDSQKGICKNHLKTEEASPTVHEIIDSLIRNEN